MKKSGFISIIGRPNVGKSTLLNQILGAKIAITSYKPQTTRTQIQGVYTDDRGQIVFIDTPGIHKPVHKLDRYMMEAASRSMGDADKVLLLVEPGAPKDQDRAILKQLQEQKAEVILVINKMDKVPKPELLKTIQKNGVNIGYVTLHVGLGTFRPVKAEEITEHHMHSEFCMISKETADIINETKRAGGRIVCVGTTSCRTLESLADENGYFHEASAWTDIFIYPGYKFKAMNALITNFHLPESTLVMLVSAFADREKILNAYNIAVQERYRFFSFGDAMFIS